MLLSIAYVSLPLCRFTDAELAALWKAASDTNRQLGITGGLYYDDRVFYQILEGDSDLVWSLMDRIQNDPRHVEVTVLVENDIASPSFRFWPVKFIDGRASTSLQTRFDPETIATLTLEDLNTNSFLLSHL